MVTGTVPRTSRAAVITKFAVPLEIRELPVPELPTKALLVKIEVATVCGTDVHLWDGSLGAAAPIDLPVVPGHEMVGRIVAFGEDAEYDSVGQKLELDDRITFTHASCGRCHFCVVIRQPSLCKQRQHYMASSCEKPPYLVGGFAEYCYVFPGSGRIRVPDNVPTELASAASCALRSVVTAFGRLGRIEHWEKVVIQGAGPLGLFATAMASTVGAERVITIGAPDSRLELARSYGATDTISIEDHPDPAERAERIRGTTDGAGADVVMEFSGAPTAFQEGLGLVRDGGRYVVAGQVGPQTSTISPVVITRRQLSIFGSWSGEAAEYWRALTFLSQTADRFDFARMIGQDYSLEQAVHALEDMQAGREIKPVVRPNGI